MLSHKKTPIRVGRCRVWGTDLIYVILCAFSVCVRYPVTMFIFCISFIVMLIIWYPGSQPEPGHLITTSSLGHIWKLPKLTAIPPPMPGDLLQKDRNFKSTINTELYGRSRQNVTASNTEKSNRPVCVKKLKNVAFLKVHKAGSTTGLNIFYRFAISHNLNVVLPRTLTTHYLGSGKSLTLSNIYPIPDNETYNILTNHVVYNREAFSKVMSPDAVYVAIVREPAAHFISAAIYYELKKKFRFAGNQNEFVFQEKAEDLVNHPENYPDLGTNWVHNRMSSDFGLKEKYFYNSSYIDAFLQNIRRDFSLVMVMERYEESLVLLKRRLCWDLKDILFVEMNVRQDDKNDLRQTEALIRGLKSWNAADYKLYEFFKKEFEKKLKEEEADFQKEVDHFRKVRSNVVAFCSTSGGRQTFSVPASLWTVSFNVTSEDCRLMTMTEMPMWQMMMKRAVKRLEISIRSKGP